MFKIVLYRQGVYSATVLRSMPRDGDRYAKKPLPKDDRQGDFYGESRVLIAERVVLPVLTGHSVEYCPTRTPVAGRVTYQRSANHRCSTLSKKIGTALWEAIVVKSGFPVAIFFPI